MTALTRRSLLELGLLGGAGTAVLNSKKSAGSGSGVTSGSSVTAPGTALATPTPAPAPISSNSVFRWKQLKLGAGGYISGMDMAKDGSKVVRCDSSGAYVWSDADDRWLLMTTMTSMPAGTWGHEVTAATGIYEVCIAPTDSSRIYLVFNGSIFRSADKGRTFTKTAITGLTGNGTDDFRCRGRKAAVDPANPDVLLVGTPAGGPLVLTTDGGATSRTISSVPGASDGNGMRVAYDPSSSVVGGRTQRVYVSSQGSGVFVSEDGGATFRATGGPNDVQHLHCDALGTVWATDGQNAGNLRRLDRNGSWRAASGDGPFKTVISDPADANHILVATPGGSIAQSFDHGATWTAIYNLNMPVRRVAGANDPAWLAWTNGDYMASGEMAFDPKVPGKLWFCDGLSVWWAQPPRTFTGFNWTSQARGIEQLTSSAFLVPPGGSPLYLAWDRPIFRLDDLTRYPATHGPDRLYSIDCGWSADYAPDNSQMLVGLFNWNGVERSGFSLDGGITWAPFASMPDEIKSGNKIGGSIATLGRGNHLIVPNNNGHPWFTKDNGVTWARCAVPGAPTSDETGWGWAYYLHRHVAVADKAAGAFYIYNYKTGLYRSDDGGANFTLAYSGQISDWTMYHAKLAAVPGKAGHLIFTTGPQDGKDVAWMQLMRSTDGGKTWAALGDTHEVNTFGLGAPAAGKSYPAIYIAGYIKAEWGVWRSDDEGATWTKLGDFPLGVGDEIRAIAGDPNVYGRVYVGFGGSGAAYGDFAS